jgi:hypothetical protein
MTKTATPEAIADALAEAKARTQRLQRQADAIKNAVNEAYERTEKSYYRRMATKVATEYRNQRDAAKDKLDALMMADPLDPIAIADALIGLRELDAKCGAMHSHASRLDYVDPLPNSHIGVPQTRPVLVSELYQQLTFAQVLDTAIRVRSERIRSQHQAELQADAQAEISAAVDQARTQAAAAIDDA